MSKIFLIVQPSLKWISTSVEISAFASNSDLVSSKLDPDKLQTGPVDLSCGNVVDNDALKRHYIRN